MWLKVLMVFWGILQLSGGASLRCYGQSIDEYDEVNLEDAVNIFNSPYYNCELSNLIYAFGFNGKIKGNYTIKVLKALLKRLKLVKKRRNVFVLNWEKEATSITTLGRIGYILSYIVSGLPASVKVGYALGAALDRMSENGFKLNETHALGHSLGAHIFGNAGRFLIQVGKSLKRISGCDPAGAFFDQYLPIMPALDKSCADFVDNTHTDPGGYGMNSSVADLDLWVNLANFIYGPEEEQVQEGCPVGEFEMFSKNDLCSHNRCLDLWIETWLGTKLTASKAVDYWTWVEYTEKGIVTDTVKLGDHTDRRAFGNYFMNTTGSPPYQLPT